MPKEKDKAINQDFEAKGGGGGESCWDNLQTAIFK